MSPFVGVRVVGVDEAVRLVVGMERQAEESLLAGLVGEAADVQEGIRLLDAV